MASQILLVVGATNQVTLTELQDTTTGLYPADATILCSVQNLDGSAVANATGLAMPYIVGTTGKATAYRAIIPATAALVVGVQYLIKLTITAAGGGGVRPMTIPAVAVAA